MTVAARLLDGGVARSIHAAARAEPPSLFLIRGGADFAPEPSEADVLDGSKVDLSSASTGEPLVTPARRSAAQRKWLIALAASCVLHAAAGLAFLNLKNEGVEIAGADQSGEASAGNAAQDQLAAGDAAFLADATNVTIVALSTPKPVEVDRIQPADSSVPLQAIDVAGAERLQPVSEAAPSVDSAERLPEAAVEMLREAPTEAVEQPTDQQAVPVHATPTPSVLEAETIAPVDHSAVVQAAVAETVDAVMPLTEESLPAEPETTPDEGRTNPEQIIAALEDVPIPSWRPAREQTSKDSAGSPPKQATPKPERAKTAKPRSGSGGKNQADARRGREDGKSKGESARSKGGNASGVGNAAVSNYPGKIVSKLRRALRYPAQAKRKRLRGEAHVQFTVDGDGGVRSVRVVKSSGSAVLDDAAAEAVRRAAPFPPIPAEAGRSNWPFTVPLAFTR